MHWRVLMAATVVMAIPLAGCGPNGGGAAAPGPVSIATTTPPSGPSTDAADASVEGPEVADGATVTTDAVAPSVTTSPTTSTPATTTPATTTSIERDVEAEVIAIAERAYDGYWECLRAPLDCDVSWMHEGSPTYEAMHHTMTLLHERGRYVGDEDVGYQVIESIEIDPSGTSAEVVTCWWMTAVLYGPPVNPELPASASNPSTIVANVPNSLMQVDRYELRDGRWAGTDSGNFDPMSDFNQCAG